MVCGPVREREPDTGILSHPGIGAGDKKILSPLSTIISELREVSTTSPAYDLSSCYGRKKGGSKYRNMRRIQRLKVKEGFLKVYFFGGYSDDDS